MLLFFTPGHQKVIELFFNQALSFERKKLACKIDGKIEGRSTDEI